jgi:hypothetical protein
MICLSIALLIWLVDPFAHDRPRPMMTGREAWEGFPPPPDVIPAMDMLPPPVICYNNTIRLQCPATGLTSPVMVIRRVDNGTTAYGGESIRREGSLGKCPIGEHTGEPISQLHKVSQVLLRSWPSRQSLSINPVHRLPWSCTLLPTCQIFLCTGTISGTLVNGSPLKRTASSTDLERRLERLHRKNRARW